MATQRWTLAATILGSSMAFLDGSVVSIAAPAIQRALDASAAQVQWVMNAYLLMLGGLMLTGGALGDRFGRRTIFVAGVVAFAGASVVCGLAPTTGWLIAARALQGAGGALLVPASLALLREHFREEERGRAIGTWAGAAALTTAAGPILGGWLVDVWSWRAIFFINVPLAAATIAIAHVHVPAGERQEDRRVDVAGAALAIAGFGALAWGLLAIAARDTGALAIAAVIAGVGLLGAMVLVEHRVAAPMMPLTVFRSRAFTGSNLATLLVYFALSGALFLLPFDLIAARGHAAATAGAALLPLTIVMGTLSRPIGGWAERHGARGPMIVGPLVAAAGLAGFGLGAGRGDYVTAVLPALLALGLGLAITVAPLTTTVMSAVGDHDVGVASGINNAVARLAGLLGIATMGTAAAAIGTSAWPGHYRVAMLVAAAAAAIASGIAAVTIDDPPRHAPRR